MQGPIETVDADDAFYYSSYYAEKRRTELWIQRPCNGLRKVFSALFIFL